MGGRGRIGEGGWEVGRKDLGEMMTGIRRVGGGRGCRK